MRAQYLVTSLTHKLDTTCSCLAAKAGFEILTTSSGSEPFLAEAALQLIHDSGSNPVHHLANYPDLHCLNLGRRGRGELQVVAALIMQARDTGEHSRRRKGESINDFMQALLPKEKYVELQSSLPASWRVGEDRPSVETFQDYAM